MSTEVRWRKGTTAQHASFIGALGEVTVDTDKDVIVVHDGSTAGGFPSVNETGLSSKAASGANSDITSLTGLTTPLSVAQGGTGGTTSASARSSLGVAPRASRVDVASFAGNVDLTTASPDSDDIRITGALAITGFTLASDRRMVVTAGGAFTLVNGANLITQTGANIVCAAGDTFGLRGLTAGVVEVMQFVKSAAAASAPSSAYNLILNGNFNVNQEVYVSGTNTSVANQYTLDQWRVVTSGQNITFAASGNGNIVTAPAGGVEQPIEGLMINATTCSINWVGTATCAVDGIARAKGESFPTVIGTNCLVRFSGGTVSQVQVNTGATAAPFEFRTPQHELFLCRRYYNRQRQYWQGSSAGLGQGQGYTWVFPCTMRVPPTMTYPSINIGGTPSTIVVDVTSVSINGPGNVNGQTEHTVVANARIV